MKILVSAGEVSGDIAGARLARELRARRPGAELFGLGGPRMAEAGVDVLVDTNGLGTVGISESFRTVPGHLRAFASLRARVAATRPDAAVLIANDVFHVGLGRWLRAHGVPTLSYFPPQVWIWRSIARAFAASFDEVLTSFPLEEKVWRAAGCSTTFVGHYLGDALRPATGEERQAARASFGLDGPDPVVAVLPGSRKQEVRRLAPVLLEAALLGTPMVIAYRVAALTIGVVRSAIALSLIESDTVGLPNLVLGRRAVPELIQRRATGAEVAAAAARLLGDGEARAAQRAALAEVARLLFAGGSDGRAAEAVLGLVERRRVPLAAPSALATEEGGGR